MNLIVSPAPHVHSGDSVRKNMLNVIIALCPALIVATIAFGMGAIITTAISVVSCVLFEWLIAKFLLKQQPHICDCSAILTGLLLAFNLPSNLPWWIVVIGALVAIGVGKMSFGGLGQNPFNPALVGRVFLLISFPVQMTTWPRPMQSFAHYLDATTGATPLSLINEGGAKAVDLMAAFLGCAGEGIGGSLGEISALALIIGGIYLLCTKTITWHIPASIIATVAVFAAVFAAVKGMPVADFVGFSLCAGGLMLGAIFMATDYVTSPMTHCGQIVYGIGIGLIVMIIRCWGAYPEGMSFAILIMNAVTPLLNMYIHPKRFGEKKAEAKK